MLSASSYHLRSDSANVAMYRDVPCCERVSYSSIVCRRFVCTCTHLLRASVRPFFPVVVNIGPPLLGRDRHILLTNGQTEEHKSTKMEVWSLVRASSISGPHLPKHFGSTNRSHPPSLWRNPSSTANPSFATVGYILGYLTRKMKVSLTSKYVNAHT